MAWGALGGRHAAGGSDTHLLRGADEHSDTPAATRREQGGLVRVGHGVVDEPDPLDRDAVCDQLGPCWLIRRGVSCGVVGVSSSFWLGSVA